MKSSTLMLEIFVFMCYYNVLFFSSSEELQRLSMVEALPRLLSGGDCASIDKMVPKLHEVWNPEINSFICEYFKP